MSNYEAQERTVYLDNGEEVTVGVEPVMDINARVSNKYTLANGTSTWEIYFNKVLL